MASESKKTRLRSHARHLACGIGQDRSHARRPRRRITTEPFSSRRTIYGFVERQNLPGLFRTFDFASPDTTSPQRFSTTVPQQALFLMNSPFVVQQARNMLERAEMKGATLDDQKIQQLYQIAFQRPAETDEIKLGKQFLAEQATKDTFLNRQPGRMAMANSLRPGAWKASLRTPLTGYAWQGSTNLPTQTGLGAVTADGGYVGNDRTTRHPAMARAPRRSYPYRKRTESPERQRRRCPGPIVSAASACWRMTAQHGKTPVASTDSKSAAAISSTVADCRQSVEPDSFHWAPTIQFIGARKPGSDELREWNATTSPVRRKCRKSVR
jgi:hypothetical protein